MSLRRFVAAAVAVALVAAVFAVTRLLMRPDEAPLEPDWEARVSTIAGAGRAGMRDGPADRALFSDPHGLAIAADGSLYVADAGEAQRIRRISPDGVVSTVAGGPEGYVDGAGHLARFQTPSGLAIDAAGAVFVADTGNNVIRRIGPDGAVSTFAGDGVAGYRDGTAREARFNGPIGVAVDPRGRVIVADTYNDRIRAISAEGVVSTLAGSGRPGWTDGPAAEAQFDTPAGVAVDEQATVYVADTGNGAIRAIQPDGRVLTLQGGAGLGRPMSVAVGPGGTTYVAGNDRIIELRSKTATRVVAGAGPGFADGTGAEARFRRVSAVAVAGEGRLFVSDATNALVRSVTAVSRRVHELPPSPLIRPAFDAATFGQLPLLWPFAPQEGPFEITGTMGEARGIESERFHAGLDVARPQGTPVYAVRDGIVSSPLAISAYETLSESIQIGAITYVHLRVGRDLFGRLFDTSRFVPTYDEHGRLVRVRVKRGARFRTGDLVGTLNAFNHAHLNIGWPGEEHNPLRFRFPHFVDTVPPTISSVRLVAEDGQPIVRDRRRRFPVSGCPDVVVDAWDQVDGNARRRRLGLYALGYQVLRSDGQPLPGYESSRQAIVFDRMTTDPGAPALVFASGTGIPGSGVRATRFLYRVTNTYRGGVAAPGCWDVSALAAGDYTLRIVAADIQGNVATRNRDVPVTISR